MNKLKNTSLGRGVGNKMNQIKKKPIYKKLKSAYDKAEKDWCDKKRSKPNMKGPPPRKNQGPA